MDYKIVYFVSTSAHRWGKGLTLLSAMEAAGVKELKKYRKDKTEAALYFAIFKPETTEAELENLKNCITADDMWGNPKFYHDPHGAEWEKDQEMIKRLFVGWVSDQVSFLRPNQKEVAHEQS